MLPVDFAIEELEDLVEGHKQGTNAAPQPGDIEWFTLRAQALGLTLLKEMRRRDLSKSPAAAERFYRQCSSHFKRQEDPVLPGEKPLAEASDVTG